MSQARWDFPPSQSVTTENRTEMPCAIPKCVLSLASREALT